MPSFQAAFQNEVMLLLYRKRTLVFLAVSILLPVILAVSLQTLQPILGLIAVSEAFPIEMLGFYTLVWIPFFIFLTAADLFPNEIAAKTLKLSLLRPITRLQVFLAKSAALAAGIAALLLILGVVTFICSLFAGSPGSLSEGAATAKAFIASYLAMAALGAVFIFIAQFFKSATASIAVSIGLYALFKLAPFFLRPVSAFSPVSYTDWHRLWLSSTVSAGKLAASSFFLLSSCVVFLILGYYLFDRKEV